MDLVVFYLQYKYGISLEAMSSWIKGYILPTTLNKWNVQNLDYNTYLGLSIFGGLFGLDYFYLGSPLMGFIKMIVNISTLGYWWYYDALNAVVSQDHVRLYGPIAPGIGPTGVAAGRFRDAKNPVGGEDQLKRHWNFLIYGIVLVVTGLFGGDSFLTGDFWNGVIRLFCMLLVIGAPVAFFWWFINMYYYFLDTGSCIDQNWLYFGAEQPDSAGAECPSALMTFTVWILETLLVILEMIPILGSVFGFLRPLINKLREAYGMVDKGVKALADAKARAERFVDKAKSRPVPSVSELQEGMLPPLPSPATCSLDEEKMKASSVPELVAKAKEPAQVGGGLDSSNPLMPYILLGAIGFVIVSSIVVSLRRLRQNGPKAVVQPGSEEATDEPPQPRDTRGPTPAH